MEDSQDLELELASGLARCLGDDAVPAEAIQAMCEVEESRKMLRWLARAMQTDEIMLAQEEGGDAVTVWNGLEGVLRTTDAHGSPMEARNEELEFMERQIEDLAGPSGRLAQLAHRRDRLASLGPVMAREGASVRSCERTTHQLCTTAVEEMSTLCSDLGYILTDIDSHVSALLSLHGGEDQSSSRTPPLLSRLSLENLVAQGEKHGEHVRKYLVLKRANEDKGETLWNGRRVLDLFEEHEFYSGELERLKKVSEWGLGDCLDADVSLSQANAELDVAKDQAVLAREGRWSKKTSDEDLEAQLVALQQETIAVERSWEYERATVAFPLTKELASMQGADALDIDAKANRERQEARMACQKHALRLLLLHAARLEVLEIAMSVELAAHRALSSCVSAASQELLQLADSWHHLASSATAKIGKELSSSAAPSAAEVALTDALVPLHVALGGDEEGHSIAFLSLQVLASEARALQDGQSHVKTDLQRVMRAHEGETRALGRLAAALQRVLWAKTTGSEPVSMPRELEESLEKLEHVKQRLDASLDSVLRDREAVQMRAGRDRMLFTDFFLRPESMASTVRQLRREAGAGSASSSPSRKMVIE